MVTSKEQEEMQLLEAQRLLKVHPGIDKDTALYGLGVREKHFNKVNGITEDDSEEEAPESFKSAVGNFTNKIEMAKRFIKKQPLYFNENGLWWIWDEEKKCWELTDEITICNYVNTSIGVDTINSKERAEILQALKQVGRMSAPEPFPNTWIQFKDVIVDVVTGQQYPAISRYFTVNPVPYKISPNDFMETPTLDKIFEEWVGKENVRTLYEIIAYCLLADYPIHRLFCLIGSGMNGKSCFLRIIEKFIGRDNCCSTELDSLLNSRFEVTRLHKKLVCIMGETNFNEISKTSILKKLTGQDLVGFEYKNKTPFEEKNYAKILIATNSLPETTDKTIGFYRRWMIIDFPNQFSEQADILSSIPEEEYECLALKCVWIIHDLLKTRKFTNEGSIEQRQKSYEEKANPFDKFFKDHVQEDLNGYIPKWEFEKVFNGWCKENRFREVSAETIGRRMKAKGIEEIRPYIQWYQNNEAVSKQVKSWAGIKWR